MAITRLSKISDYLRKHVTEIKDDDLLEVNDDGTFDVITAEEIREQVISPELERVHNSLKALYENKNLTWKLPPKA